MQTSTRWFTSLMLALAVMATASPPATAAAETARTEQANKQTLEQWREARRKFEALAAKYQSDPSKSKLLAKFNETLGETQGALEQALGAMSAPPPGDSKKVAAAIEQLKKKLGELSSQQAKLKSDKELASASTNLMNVLGDVLSKQQQTSRGAVQNLR